MIPPCLPRVAAGERAAVRECIERYGGLVWSLARRACGSSGDAEDAVQEIFLDLWRSAARFDAKAGAEVSFVATIARRRLIDRRRASKRRPETDPLSEGRAGEAQTMPPEVHAEAALAARALDQLRPEQRQVLLMMTCQGLSHEEVASTTGMPLGTVKAHARRGLMRVREFLGEASLPAPMGGARS